MPIAITAKKRSLLPLLTFLFVLSYGLMTVVIVEQGSVIQSQRNLIKVLNRDSTELWAGRGKAIGDQQSAKAQAEAKNRSQAPTTQEQSTTQTPSTQVPSHTPSTQAAPQHRLQSRIGKTARPERQLPPEPASDLVDRRRSLDSI
jgi:phosphoglycerol transferase MdoB-like AlkP superfamily enzyme